MEPNEIDIYKLIDDLAPIMAPKVPFEALYDIMTDIQKVLGSAFAITVWSVISDQYLKYTYSSVKKKLCKSIEQSIDHAP